MKRIFILIAVLLFFGSCGSESPRQNHIVVTIEPLKYLVSAITGDDFKVDVLVPPGASPESYEPTPRQLISLSKARLLFATGLIDFEKELTERVGNNDVRLIEVSKGIDLIEENHGGHSHGIDPHIWTSPIELKKIAKNIYDVIAEIYPDSTKYRLNYSQLRDSLDSLNHQLKTMIEESGIKSFFIYHPALSYYARDYGLIQIPLEKEGKEPSAEYLKYFIQLAKQDTIRKILYQKQFSQAAVNAVAKAAGAEPVEIDPLGEDIPANLLYITKCITTK